MDEHHAISDQPTDSSSSAGHVTHFDPQVDSVVEELIMAMATVTDVAPTDLDVLADTLDPDALDALFHPRTDGTHPESDTHARLRYADHVVDIQSSGTIAFRPLADDD